MAKMKRMSRTVPKFDSGTVGAGSSSENTDKNQSSLALGSAGYRERLMDKAGLEDESFVASGQVFEAAPVGHVKINEDVRVESDEHQETAHLPEAEHVSELAGDVQAFSQAQRNRDRATADMKYRNRMAKLDKYPEILRAAQEAALETETQSDDKKVAKLAKRDCDDMPEILDDGMTADDFMPRSFRKYIE